MAVFFKSVLFGEDGSWPQKKLAYDAEYDAHFVETQKPYKASKYKYNERFEVDGVTYYVTPDDFVYRLFPVNDTIELVLMVGIADYWEHEVKIPRSNESNVKCSMNGIDLYVKFCETYRLKPGLFEREYATIYEDLSELDDKLRFKVIRWDEFKFHLTLEFWDLVAEERYKIRCEKVAIEGPYISCIIADLRNEYISKDQALKEFGVMLQEQLYGKRGTDI